MIIIENEQRNLWASWFADQMHGKQGTRSSSYYVPRKERRLRNWRCISIHPVIQSVFLVRIVYVPIENIDILNRGRYLGAWSAQSFPLGDFNMIICSVPDHKAACANLTDQIRTANTIDAITGHSFRAISWDYDLPMKNSITKGAARFRSLNSRAALGQLVTVSGRCGAILQQV